MLNQYHVVLELDPKFQYGPEALNGIYGRSSAQVRAFAQALGKRAKTDLIDAAVITHFAEATKPKLRQMPDEVTRLLADPVARRRQIVSPDDVRRWRKNSLSWTS
jgi:hypothetical protein